MKLEGSEIDTNVLEFIQSLEVEVKKFYLPNLILVRYGKIN